MMSNDSLRKSKERQKQKIVNVKWSVASKTNWKK